MNHSTLPEIKYFNALVIRNVSSFSETLLVTNAAFGTYGRAAPKTDIGVGKHGPNRTIDTSGV